MRHTSFAVICLALFCAAAHSQTDAVVYEGARLITGDASPTVESGAFVVAKGHIVAIGRRDQVKAPPGARHIDLTGKTVIPALNNIHIHIGYEGYVSWDVKNHTPGNVLDHLEREAYFGVGTAMTMGDQPVDFAQQFQKD